MTERLDGRVEHAFFQLVYHAIPFRVHYPAASGLVLTIEENVNNEQLRALSELGASMGPKGILQILINT